MQKLAIIGASYLQEPLVLKAKEMGLYTFCFAWEDGAVCKDLVDEFFPISIVEKEEILKICQQEHIDGICTIASDVAAPTVAYVAHKMGLVGNDHEAAVRANNKFAMRNAFMAADVPCPKFAMVKSDEATKWLNGEMAKEMGLELPLIIKPTDRSGSLGVTKVTSWDQFAFALTFALDKSFKKEAMVEEFIEGREISVEFISYHSKHYPLQITDKVTTEAPHFVELEHHQPSTLSPEMYKQIYEITDRALTALGLTNGASHSEYKITKEGRIAVMEIGGRMGGDFIGSDLVRLSTGYDFVKGVIEVALGEFEEPAINHNPSTINAIKSQKHSGVFFLCKETQSLLPTIQDAIAHPDLHPEVFKAEITNKELRPVTCSADRSGYMIYQANKIIHI